MIVYGIGSGRCGTASLANLLNRQHDALVFHEMNPHAMSWQGSEDKVRADANAFARALETGRLDVKVTHEMWNGEAIEKMGRMEQFNIVGDIGFYYLPYIETILSVVPQAKFIGLRRDEDATVESYLRKTRSYRYPAWLKFLPGYEKIRNHWIDHDGSQWAADDIWDKCYPKYEAQTKQEALHLYWRDYYARAAALENKYPDNVRVWELDRLNSEEGQREILGFLGLALHEQVLDVGLRTNGKKG